MTAQEEEHVLDAVQERWVTLNDAEQAAEAEVVEGLFGVGTVAADEECEEDLAAAVGAAAPPYGL